MKKPHPAHAAIAKALGVTPVTLHALLAIKAGRGSLNRGPWLIEKGLVVDNGEGRVTNWKLTEAGASLLARARTMGF